MRKKFLGFLLACSGSLFALPLQNPADPSFLEEGIFISSDNLCLYYCKFPCWLDFQFGYYGDFVWDRKLETDKGEGVHKTRMFTNAAIFGFNFCELFTLYGTAGATNFFINADQRVLTGLDVISNMMDVDTASNVSWSVGAQVALLESGGWTLGLEGQYFQAWPKVKSITRNTGDATVPFYLTDAKFKYWEWQVGGGLSYEIEVGEDSAFVPYVGLKWSEARLNPNNNVLIPTATSPLTTAEMLELKQSMNWGYVIGVTFVAFATGSITAEARFLDEKALHINMKLRF